MNRFDRIKLITKSDYITIPLNSEFTLISNRKYDTNIFKYTSKSPYLLSIAINPATKRATIEFTGKILLDSYSKLISMETIGECITKINDTGLCQMDVDSIIHDSTVGKLDVTMDVNVRMSEQVKTLLSMAIVDPKKWEGKIRKRNGIDIKKDVKSDSVRKERISFYDKGDELKRSTNRPFLQVLQNPQQMMDYFEGKTRIEYNISSGVMIKKVLEIDSLELLDVLNTKTLVLEKICSTIFDRSLIANLKDGNLGFLLFENIQDYYQSLMLEKYDDNERAIEPVFRHFYSAKSNFRKKRTRLRKVRNIRLNGAGNITNQLHHFDDLLEKIRNAA